MKSEKYKGVHFIESNHLKFKTFKKKWRAKLTRKGVIWGCSYLTEREAAVGYDMRLIRYGLEPVNILIRK